MHQIKIPQNGNQNNTNSDCSASQGSKHRFGVSPMCGRVASPRRVDVRTECSRPFVGALDTWLREQRTRVSKNSDTGKAVDHVIAR